jgi:hypothetical protein
MCPDSMLRERPERGEWAQDDIAFPAKSRLPAYPLTRLEQPAFRCRPEAGQTLEAIL